MDNHFLAQRITRDITDGLLLIDLNGKIIYINPHGKEILSHPDLLEGMSYAEFMASDDSGLNDAFHQAVLDSVYDKHTTHNGPITYHRPDGSIRHLDISSSYIQSNDPDEISGVVLRFSDVTKLRRMQIKYTDAVKILIALIVIVSLWNFIYAVWDYLDIPITPTGLTMIIEILGGIAAIGALKFTSITLHDFGLGKGTNLKKSLIVDGVFTAVMLLVMIILKTILRPGEPIIELSNWGPATTLYPVTVVAQELLTRGVAQGSLVMVLPENTPVIVPILISSLIFGALHIHKGLLYMLGAALLLGIFGLIYSKQKTIWGLCIPHYFMGLALTLIWGMY